MLCILLYVSGAYIKFNNLVPKQPSCFWFCFVKGLKKYWLKFLVKPKPNCKL